MPGPDGPWSAALAAAVRDGRIAESVVDRKVLRILRLAVRVGALSRFETPAPAGNGTPEDGPGFAREAAAEGTVLLRNAGELPWRPERLSRIAVVGQHATQPRTQGGGSATVVPSSTVSPLQGIRAAFPGAEIVYEPGAVVQDGIIPFAPEAMTNPVTGEPGAHVRLLDDVFKNIPGGLIGDPPFALLCLVLALPAFAQTTLNGAGATFPYPMYSKWFSEYHKAHPDIEINYQSIGSGGGIRQVLAGTVDFGASDGPMTDEQLAQAKTKILHVPTVLGAVVPAYNVAGVTGEIKFSPEALAGIFLGKITTWNDPPIASANPGVKLPNDPIVVVHRSDGSGTTYIWTDYLSKVSGDWQSQVGKGTSVRWPVGLGGKGNEGVAGMIRQMQGSSGTSS